MSGSRTIGEVLRELREERGELLREVAGDSRLDIDPTLLSHIENGRRVPTPPQLEGLAAHYGLPAEELMPYVDASLNERARTSWGRRSRSDGGTSSAPRTSASRAKMLRGPSEPQPDLDQLPSGPSASEIVPASMTARPAPPAAQTMADALGDAETSSELAVDGLAETAQTALDRLRRIADDRSAPRPMRTRARRAIEYLCGPSGR